MIIYYGIREKESTTNIIEYHYNDEEKIFDVEATVNHSNIYELFKIKTEKTAVYLNY